MDRGKIECPSSWSSDESESDSEYDWKPSEYVNDVVRVRDLMEGIRQALLPWSKEPEFAKSLQHFQAKLEIKCAQMDEEKQLEDFTLERLSACLDKWKKLLKDQ